MLVKDKYLGSDKISSRSFSAKTTLLLSHVFGKRKPDKKVFTISSVSKGKKVMIGMRKVRPVKINGVIYGSIAIACRQLNLDRYTIVKRCESTELSDRNFKFI